jgi:hypothetical protein
MKTNISAIAIAACLVLPTTAVTAFGETLTAEVKKGAEMLDAEGFSVKSIEFYDGKIQFDAEKETTERVLIVDAISGKVVGDAKEEMDDMATEAKKDSEDHHEGECGDEEKKDE